MLTSTNCPSRCICLSRRIATNQFPPQVACSHTSPSLVHEAPTELRQQLQINLTADCQRSPFTAKIKSSLEKYTKPRESHARLLSVGDRQFHISNWCSRWWWPDMNQDLEFRRFNLMTSNKARITCEAWRKALAETKGEGPLDYR
jgi:hypothetical protein